MYFIELNLELETWTHGAFSTLSVSFGPEQGLSFGVMRQGAVICCGPFTLFITWSTPSTTRLCCYHSPRGLHNCSDEWHGALCFGPEVINGAKN